MKSKLLYSLSLPHDLKKLGIEEEKELCCEIRDKIIKTVSNNGGHLASNLGVVELTLAIHKVFDSPKDKIIFDVGHQCYTHKILTGRLSEFDTLRRKDGISGFSRPDESPHDPVISGHSSTSISSALGIAEAMKLCGDDHHVVAVVGDGALTGGLAYEGLNIAGKSGTKIIVVVNYNEMSISKNIGGIAEYLSQMRTKKTYKQVKSKASHFLSSLPLIGKPLHRSVRLSMDIIKGNIIDSTFFEDFGFEYIGPVDGHDLAALETALSSARSVNGPVVVQVNTIKGKGYSFAEQNPGEYHSVSGFDIKTGQTKAFRQSFPSEFGKTLVKVAESDSRICAVTAAMKYGTGLNYFSKAYPDRFFDVGIAEQHAVTFSAGLAGMGMIPVFAVYSSFMQRCYDQIIHDIAIAELHCVFAVCNSGIVGEDGETHQGLFDVPFVSTIPNTVIYSPSSYKEAEICLNHAIYKDSGAVFIRLPKGAQTCSDYSENSYELMSSGSDILIISYGREAVNAQQSAKKQNIDFLKLIKIYPIDSEIIKTINSYGKAYMFEECSYQGSIGQKLKSLCPNLDVIAIDGFVKHMSACEALELYGLSENKITQRLSDDHMKEESTLNDKA